MPTGPGLKRREHLELRARRSPEWRWVARAAPRMEFPAYHQPCQSICGTWSFFDRATWGRTHRWCPDWPGCRLTRLSGPCFPLDHDRSIGRGPPVAPLQVLVERHGLCRRRSVYPGSPPKVSSMEQGPSRRSSWATVLQAPSESALESVAVRGPLFRRRLRIELLWAFDST
jgi:hypothetical protein